MGRDDLGCHLLVNKKPHQQMASQPEPEEPPEFQRGPVKSSFGHGPIFMTNFAVFDKKTQRMVNVRVSWNRKNRVFIMHVSDKEQTMMRNIKWQKLEKGTKITLILPNLNMKLMAQLALSKDQFQLDINGDDVFDLQRYVEEEEKKEGESDTLE